MLIGTGEYPGASGAGASPQPGVQYGFKGAFSLHFEAMVLANVLLLGPPKLYEDGLG